MGELRGATWPIAFSAADDFAVSSNAEKELVAWDLTRLPGEARLGQLPAVGETAPEFSPTRMMLASVEEAGRVVVRDLAEPRQARRVAFLAPRQRAGTNFVTFTADGTALLIGYTDGTLRRWDLTGTLAQIDGAVALACERTAGGMSRAEWAQELPGWEYRNPCHS